MKVVDRGIVFVGQKGTDSQSCAFPGICVLPGGRWICNFRAAPTKSSTSGQRPLITWSDDYGNSWSEPTAPFSPCAVEGKLGLFRAACCTALGQNRILAALAWVDHTDPSLPFFNPQTEGLLDTRAFLARSEDSGATWSEPKLMDTSPFEVPVPLTGPVLSLANNELACQFELNKHYYDTSPWQHSSVLIFSKDGGKSWPEHVITSHDPANRMFYWDQRPGLLADGRILNVFWTFDNQASVYLNIHACESLDNGHTWSELWDTGVPGQPATPASLPDGRVAMVYVDRSQEPIIKMRLSEDNGRTWPDGTELILSQAVGKSQTVQKSSMPDAWAEMGKFSIGLPATALTPEGDIVVVYYAGPDTDQTDILWVRLRAG